MSVNDINPEKKMTANTAGAFQQGSSWFLASEKEVLFSDLRRQRFNGKLVFEDRKGQQWSFFLCFGRFVHATGGIHPVRRWCRQLSLHCPTFKWDDASQASSLDCTPQFIQSVGWEYDCLRLWLEQNLITRDQGVQIVNDIAREILFDLIQAGQVTHQLLPSEAPALFNADDFGAYYFSLVDLERLVQPAHQLWQKWEEAKLIHYLPNRAPLIKRSEQLQQQTSDAVYKVLRSLLTGQHSLRDLAVARKRNVIEITRSLEPYLVAGLVELKQIPDLPPPEIAKALINTCHGGNLGAAAEANGPMIACVDDSPLVCQTMERIFRGAGYRFIGIQDSLRALPQLLSHKPSLIFLDLVMPNTNGYEVCAQLRKTSLFRDTPIVILTGNDGIVDRVRAKVVGATDFLGKPVDSQTVLAVTQKHIAAEL
jgi:chemotaxis family two-component system response regulator PixG